MTSPFVQATSALLLVLLVGLANSAHGSYSVSVATTATGSSQTVEIEADMPGPAAAAVGTGAPEAVEMLTLTPAVTLTATPPLGDLKALPPKGTLNNKEYAEYLHNLALEHNFQVPAVEKLPTLSELIKACPLHPEESNFQRHGLRADTGARGGATTVHNLRPEDITVVMALGDSISAGFGIISDPLLDGLWEYRGLAFSMGGDDEAVSMPNILDRASSHNIQGRSLKWELPLDALKISNRVIREHNPDTDVLNAAQSGADSEALQNQIDYLLAEVENRGIARSDWKVLTHFMGSNDICRVCEKSSVDEAVALYKKNVQAALNRLKAEVPNVFVNLIAPLDVVQVYEFMNKESYCQTVWSNIGECNCILGAAANDQTRKMAREFKGRITAFLEAEVRRFQAQRSDTFAVVYQPFLHHAAITDQDQLSRIDCFHPSEKTQRVFAVNLWNSMLTPLADKVQTISPDLPDIMCVTKNTYFRTD